MTVEEVARLSKHSPQTIREGLKRGMFDFGTAFKRPESTQWVYVIYPEKVYELFGKEK